MSGVLGYAVHDAIERGGGYLGMLDLRDPIELFQEGWPASALGTESVVDLSQPSTTRVWSSLTALALRVRDHAAP